MLQVPVLTGRDIMAECRFHRFSCPAMLGSSVSGEAPTTLKQLPWLHRIVTVKQVVAFLTKVVKRHARAAQWCVGAYVLEGVTCWLKSCVFVVCV